MESYESAFRH